MATLMQASRQWASRPADERFTSLIDMADHFNVIRQQCREVVAPSKKLTVVPTEDNKGIEIRGPNGHGYAPTHWSFGQLAALAEAPSGYLRTLPSPIAADCVNYGLQFKRPLEDVGVLIQRNGESVLRAATGPKYGRVWNSDVVHALVNQFGNGVSGQWKVPGEFGRDVIVTKDNTTLFAGDRDMFVFLADEKNRIEIPNRRNGKSGDMARGFFMWNSEVGKTSIGWATFLFDYVCCNRIVWGAAEYQEVRVRHTASAPDKWLDEMRPALISYSNSASTSVINAIKAAQAKVIGKDKVDEFLATRFGKSMVEPLKVIHRAEEDRPIETFWDVTTAATAYARSITHQDTRVKMERTAGELLNA